MIDLSHRALVFPSIKWKYLYQHKIWNNTVKDLLRRKVLNEFEKAPFPQALNS